MCRCIQNLVDWSFVASILSPQELFQDLGSRRKQVFVAGFILLLAAGAVFWVELEIWSFITSQLEHPPYVMTIALTFIIYSVEPLFLVLEALIAPHPTHNLVNEHPPECTNRIAVVIPCHHSSDVVVRTVRSCMKHVQPSQIFVVDNANFPNPPDKTREILEDEDLHEVNYIYNPYGNKTLALYAGCVAAKDFSHVLLMDDDTCLPENMNFGLHLLSFPVKAICYPIRAVHPNGDQRETLFIKWQGLEYKSSDFAKHLQSKYCSVLYPHGAVSLWDRKTAIKCLREHDTVFYADDVKMGMYLQRTNYYEMRLHPTTVVDTEAPATLVGPYPNYFNQRVRSWDMSEFVYAYEFVRLLFVTKHRKWSGMLILKAFQLYGCYSLVADALRTPIIAIMVWTSPIFFLSVSGCCFVFHTWLLIVWDYLAFRRCPHRRSELFVLLTYQFYRFPVLFFRFLGMIRAYTVYLPNYKRKPTIPEIEKEILEAPKPRQRRGRLPVWMDRTNHLYQHYDPKRPTGSSLIGPNADKRDKKIDPEDISIADSTGADESTTWDDFSSKVMSYVSCKQDSVTKSTTSNPNSVEGTMYEV